MNQTVRVRMAPSPTGFLHVGTAQSALYNWLFARQQKGAFILRIEDTDLERSKREYEDDILENLKWLGLEWDEFYRQTDRFPIYRKYLEKLLAEGTAFYCRHTPTELEAERKKQAEEKQVPRHVCAHKQERSGGAEGVIRLAVNENSDRKIRFEDIIRGPIEFDERLLGDISIARNLDSALYHFTVVVDDYEMSISHVIRGEDHIANTPKQILIAEALGFPVPRFAHLPLLLAPDRSKLSKRTGMTGVKDYRADYLPQALANFLAGLSFTFGTEILTLDEMRTEFDLATVHKSGAVFDVAKLDWMNGEYLKRLSDEELMKHLIPHLADYGPADPELFKRALPFIRERIRKFSDVKEFDFFFRDPDYDRELLRWKDQDDAALKKSLETVKGILASGVADLRAGLDSAAEGSRGLLYWPFRVALSGRKASPDPVDIAGVIGREAALRRVDRALALL